MNYDADYSKLIEGNFYRGASDIEVLLNFQVKQCDSLPIQSQCQASILQHGDDKANMLKLYISEKAILIKCYLSRGKMFAEGNDYRKCIYPHRKIQSRDVHTSALVIYHCVLLSRYARNI